ncbi:MAG TPA: hypothetical protein VKB01_07540, partial [Thermomicrobiales bacterium]|nr:hypothetical protein [Thermomicrobiales bacterium]
MVERSTGHAQNVIDLRPLPRKRLRDVVPVIGRVADTRAVRKHAQRVTESLAWTRSYLAEHAIPVEQQCSDDDVFDRLL